MTLAHIVGAAIGASLAITTLAGTTGGVATGDPYFFVTNGSTLYRFQQGGPVDSFDIGVELNSLSFDSSGRLWGTEVNDSDADGNYCLHEILNPYGALSSTERGDFLTGRVGSLMSMGNSLVGFETTVGRLIQIDQLAESFGTLAFLGEESTRPQSSAYDPDTDTIYGIRNTRLYAITLDGGYTQTEIAELFPYTTGPTGGDWYDGEYYHVINNGSSTHLFTINVVTGEMTEFMVFDSEGRGATGLAIGVPVPTPGTAALMAAGGLLAARRRR